MKVLLPMLLGAVGLGGAFWLGWATARSADFTEALRRAGISKESAKLYVRAGKILNRLAQVTDLDGAYAGDVLSEETRRQVTEWVAAYREQVNKV